MHFYQQNIADYRKKTMGLSPIEHGIYRLLMDTYYLTEQPLELDLEELMRSHSVRTADEQVAFKYVLKKFFHKTPDGYRNKRCDKEIESFYAKSDKARQSAKARWNKGLSCGGNANAMRSHSDGNADGMLPHNPITSIPHNPLPITPDLKANNKVKNSSVAQKRAPTQKAKDLPETELQIACRATWNAYRDAYFARYDVDPVRNAKINGQVKLLVGRLGADDAPHVAAFYVGSRTEYYLKRGHSLDCLLADAEKLRTEWATGKTSITNTMARHEDRTQSVSQVVQGAMKILEDKENAKTKPS